MRISSTIVIVFFALTIFYGCQKTDDGDYVKPITIYEKINGTWNLSSLIYSDDYAKSLGLESVEENLTNWFNFNTFQISFNVNSKDEPTDYVVSGDIPNLFPSNGFWELNSPFPTTNTQPVIIILFSDSQKTTQIGELNLTMIPGTNNIMEFRLIRSSNGVQFSSYIFRLYSIN